MKDERKTLKILYWIIAVLGVISFFMEFDVIAKIIDLIIKDVEDLGPFSFVLSIKAHLQQHGNFYENIALGGLASAVISAVAVKVSIDILLKNISLSYTRAVREMAGAYGQVLDKIKKYKNLRQLEDLESSNKYFITSIYSFIETIDKHPDENIPSKPELVQLCKDTLIPLAKSISAIIVCIRSHSELYRKWLVGWKDDDFEVALLRCMQVSYRMLDEEYNFEHINSVFLKYGFDLDSISGYYLDLVSNLLKEADEAVLQGKYYVLEEAMETVFGDIYTEVCWRILREIKSETTEPPKTNTNPPTGESVKPDAPPRTSKSVKGNPKRKRSKIEQKVLESLKRLGL